MLKSANLGIAALLGVALIANGVFMLVALADWYVAVPGVTATGPFNQHFLRDIGLIFLLLGARFWLGRRSLICASRFGPRLRSG